MRHNALTLPQNAGNLISEYFSFKTFCTPLAKTAFRQWSLVPLSELVANSKASALLATTHVFLHICLSCYLFNLPLFFFYCC